jgi:hypothetical protein
VHVNFELALPAHKHRHRKQSLDLYVYIHHVYARMLCRAPCSKTHRANSRILSM